MESSLKNQVVCITGAASGIGRVTARMLVRLGALVSLADVNKTALDAMVAELLQDGVGGGDEARTPPLATVLDVRSQEACTAWIDATVSHFGGKPIAAAANLAGVISPSIGLERGAIRNVSDADFDWVIDVNLKGTLNCLRAELPRMLVGQNGRGGGSIVNAASIAAIMGVERNGPYVAAKHAVAGLTRTVAKEEGPNAIRVNAIAPGIIATPMITQIETTAGTTELFGEGRGDPGALARKGDAEEVARLICFLLGSESSFVNGTVIPVDGGWMC
ncbi:putative short chain dehydrogenase/ reductase [Rostrohypoxylon terebratum]|nr:putative short chain dehydrogenase/ reductase [Rostrohypoxylon terebratum]